ncbi:DUF3000 family protein [Bifidobacterium eulemuris]|uniref:DUF3000 family protein n=2 Tax=Bifidobacterium eulemuris TaxID=1765219 RepID=A0A7L9SLL2_9BIFI|nr:DUF3000 family protein [Bifidobacterium eulemuris]QOL31115.1 DUF3000 family protein [Bifidobacterium eulemuris]
MADIYAFPTGAPPTASAPRQDGLPERPAGVPDEMWNAVESVRDMTRVADVRYREIPVPSTLADYGIGVELECGERDGNTASFSSDLSHSPRLATGWIMILFSAQSRIDWAGRWRCVAFTRLPLHASENDGLAPRMYWDDMCDFLSDVDPDSVGGTVTVTQNTSFGSLLSEAEAGCEMRVSWSPLGLPDGGLDAGAQVGMWARFIRSTVRFDEGLGSDSSD